LFCNGLETCDVLADCQSGAPPDCDDGVDCTDDSCNEESDACESAPNHSLCDDTLFCDGQETCDAILGCQSGTPPCPSGCDESVNECIVTSNPPCSVEGAGCSDGNPCTGSDTCVGGVCIGDPLASAVQGSPCDDNNTCTLGEFCDDGACVGGDPAANGTPCDDGNASTSGDNCDGEGTCRGGG
jgi:hypothetical protein